MPRKRWVLPGQKVSAEPITESDSEPQRNELNNNQIASISSGSSSSSSYSQDANHEVAAGLSKDDEGWKVLPSLTQGMKRNSDGNVELPFYICETEQFREYERKEREELFRVEEEMKALKEAFNQALQFTRAFCPDIRSKKVKDVLPVLGNPTTYRDLVLQLLKKGKDEALTASEADTSTEEELFSPVTPGPLKSKRAIKPSVFPTTTKMLSAPPSSTRGGTGVFEFGQQRPSTAYSCPSSSRKPPRLPKQGEIFYSVQGSPILFKTPPAIRKPERDSTRERIQVTEPNGSKIEVELVYRGDNEAAKLRAFNQLTMDVRVMATKKSTGKPKRAGAKGPKLSKNKK